MIVVCCGACGDTIWQLAGIRNDATYDNDLCDTCTEYLKLEKSLEEEVVEPVEAVEENPKVVATCDGCRKTKSLQFWQKTHYRLCTTCAAIWTAQKRWRGFDDEVLH